MAEKIGFEIDLKAPGAGKTVAELRKEIKDLTNDIGSLNTGTKEYARAIQALGEKKAALKDLKEDIKALDPDEKAKAFVRLGQTVAGGFAAASGAAALFNVSNKEVEQQLLKVQAATAILSGVQAVADAREELGRIKIIALKIQDSIVTKAQAVATATYSTIVGVLTGNISLATVATNIWGAAMKVALGPIGLIIAGVAAIGAAMYAFSGNTKENTEEVLKNTQALRKNKEEHEALEAELSAAQRRLDKEKGLITASEEEKLNIRDKYNLENIKRSRDLDEQLLQASVDFKDGSEAGEIAYQKRIKELTEAYYSDLQTLSKTQAAETLTADTKAKNEAAEKEKKRLEDLKKKQDENAAFLFEENEKERKLKEARELAEKEAKDKTAIADAEEAERFRKVDEESTKIAVDAEVAKGAAVLEEHNINLANIAQADEASLATQKQITDAKLSIAQSGVDGLTSLSELLAKNGEEQNAFQKGIALAQIAVNTARSISAAVAGATEAAAATGPAAPFTLAAYIASGIASVVGAMASASKILGAAPKVSTPSFTRPSAPNIGGGTQGLSQAAPRVVGTRVTTLINNRNNEGENFMPIVIQNNIVESEITGTQKNINRIRTRAKIG